MLIKILRTSVHDYKMPRFVEYGPLLYRKTASEQTLMLYGYEKSNTVRFLSFVELNAAVQIACVIKTVLASCCQVNK